MNKQEYRGSIQPCVCVICTKEVKNVPIKYRSLHSVKESDDVKLLSLHSGVNLPISHDLK